MNLPEFPVMTETQLNRISQALLDSMPRGSDGTAYPFVMGIFTDDGFQTVSNLHGTDNIRLFVRELAQRCAAPEEPVNHSTYTPPSRN